MAADNFGNVFRAVVWVAGILALGAEDQRAVVAGHEATGAQARGQHFIGGAGPGGAFQADELAGAHVGQRGVDGVDDEAQVRLAVGVEWRGHADDERIHLARAGEVGGGLEALAARGLDQVNCQPFNVALPRIEHVDLARVDVKAKDLKAHLGKTKRQRQADVTQAIDADHSSLVGNPRFESLKSVHGWKGNGCWVVVTAHVKKCACHVQN